MTELMTEGFVQILPQAPTDQVDEDGGYSRKVREMTTLSSSSGVSSQINPSLTFFNVPLMYTQLPPTCPPVDPKFTSNLPLLVL